MFGQYNYVLFFLHIFRIEMFEMAKFCHSQSCNIFIDVVKWTFTMAKISSYIDQLDNLFIN